jgi:MFS transporter, OFA family, oxalate/formate antiporter
MQGRLFLRPFSFPARSTCGADGVSTFEAGTAAGTHLAYRRKLILIDFIVMMIIGVYQYSWSLSAFSIINELKWDLTTVSATFSAYLLTQAFIQPVSGLIADSYGPRKMMAISSLLVGMGFILSSFIRAPWQLYLFYALGGLGVGALDNISTAVAVKWFPEKKGFAGGFVTFGFAAGAGVFNLFIQALLESYGFRTTFRWLGLTVLLLLTFLTSYYRYPPEGWDSFFRVSSKIGRRKSADYRPGEMLSTYQWYLIYLSFVVTISIVLMFGAQIRMLLHEFEIPRTFINLIIVLFPIGNGLSRIFAGTVSDRIGRGRTMMIFYSVLALAILSLIPLRHAPVLFTGMVFIVCLLGGSPFGLYPAIIGEYYGLKGFTTNYGITITAKAWAGLVSGVLIGFLVTQFGSYKIPLIFLSVCSFLAALLSTPILMKPPSRKAARV